MTHFKLGFYVAPVAEDVEDNLDTLADLGIKLVGSDGMSSQDHEGIGRFRRLTGERGLKVWSVHGVGAFYDPQADTATVIERLRCEVDRCAALECPNLVFHHRQVQTASWGDGSLAEWSQIIAELGLNEFDRIVAEVLDAVADYASEHAIRICLENLGPPFRYCQCVEHILPIFEMLDADNVGICLDSGHAFLSGHTPAQQIRSAGRRLLTTHFVDSFGPLPPWYDIYCSDVHTVVGIGVIDWVEVLRALAEVGYAEPIIFEGPHLPQHTFRDSVRMTVDNWRAFEAMCDELAAPGE